MPRIWARFLAQKTGLILVPKTGAEKPNKLVTHGVWKLGSDICALEFFEALHRLVLGRREDIGQCVDWVGGGGEEVWKIGSWKESCHMFAIVR